MTNYYLRSRNNKHIAIAKTQIEARRLAIQYLSTLKSLRDDSVGVYNEKGDHLGTVFWFEKRWVWSYDTVWKGPRIRPIHMNGSFDPYLKFLI